MQFKWVCLGCFLVLASKSFAIAQMDASTLFLQCRSAIIILKEKKPTDLLTIFNAQSCLSYLHGFQHGYQLGEQQACIPKEIDTLAVAEIYTVYLEDYPFQRHKHPAHILNLALLEKFSCTK